jgi:hypothetical protein
MPTNNLKENTMKIEKININKIKTNPDNPRLIKDYKFERLTKSIKGFPEMLKIRPIIVNEDMTVLGGNMRLKACKEAGLKDVYIIKASELTEEQQKEFIIKDNVSFGEWDWDMIANEWSTVNLDDWGVDVWQNTDDMINMINDSDENSEWVGMPEFEAKDEALKIVISFEKEEDREIYAKEHKMQFIKKQHNAWMTRYPFIDREDLISLKYE